LKSSRLKQKSLPDKVKEKNQALSGYSENVEEEIEQLKSDYFELLNEQASVRNELQFLEDQMSQSAAQQKRLADKTMKNI
jgi:chromosome segregation protein